MTVFQKAALSFLIALAIFAGITVVTLAGFFNNAAFASFPAPMKALLFGSFFLTIFLTLFFCLNIRQDPMLIIQYRLKELQISLIEQFYECKGTMDWTRWTIEMEQRREGVRAEIKRGVSITRSSYSEAEADSLIDKSWDELLAFISAQQKAAFGMDEEKLRGLLYRVLQTMPGAASTVLTPATEPALSAGVPAGVPAAEAPLPSAAAGNLTFPEISKPARISPAGGLLAVAIQKRAVFEIDHEVQAMQEEEAEELEELEEVEVLEELEEDNPVTEVSAAAGPRVSAQNIKELESMIEFADDDAGAEESVEIQSAELEIVSPFSSMFSPLESDAILQEQDGVPHVNSSVLDAGKQTEVNLDQHFKDLVDEVIKP